MTALIYFGEMLVASLLAILLLAISPFGLSSDATLFAAGIVAWTFAEYQPNMGFIMPAPTQQSSLFFGRYGPVSH
jgi:hypothetical protein